MTIPIISDIRLHEAIAKRSPIIVADLDSGEIVYASTRAEQIFGYFCVGDLVGMKVEDLIPEDKREIHVQYRMGFSQNPSPMLMGERRKLFGLKKDGNQFPVEIELGSEKIQGARLAFLTIIDLSERVISPEPLSSS